MPHDGPGCAEIDADEKQASTVTWDKNGNLGRFTNFVNLMDMAAIAVPSGILRCKPAPASSTGQSPLHTTPFAYKLISLTICKVLAMQLKQSCTGASCWGM